LSESHDYSLHLYGVVSPAIIYFVGVHSIFSLPIAHEG